MLRNERIDTMARLWLGAFAGLAILALATESAQAGSSQRTGTNGAFELRMPVGPRGSALGTAVASDITGIEAIFWNPAGLGGMEGTEALVTHTSLFAGQKLNFAALATKVGGFGVVGLNAKVLSIGDIIVTTEDAPEGTGEILTPTFAVLGASWGRQFTDHVQFGATFNYVTERIAQATASGVAMDLGVQYSTGWRGLSFGMVMKNFGTSMEFGGEAFEINTLPPDSDPAASNRTFRSTSASFELPSYFTLAAGYDLASDPQYKIRALGAFQNNNFTHDNVCGAMELTFRSAYSLRGSYFASFGSNTDVNGNETSVEFDSGDDVYSGYALGAGAQIRAGETGRLNVDLAWRPIRDFFDDTVEVGLKFRF